MNAYAQKSTRAQILYLRRHAEAFAQEFGLEGSRISVLAHAYNTTFRVEHPVRGKFALRININSPRSPGNVISEVAWLIDLEQRGAATLRLLPSPAGDYVISRTSDLFDRPLVAVCSHWVEGRTLSNKPSYRELYMLGSLTRKLHESKPEMPGSAELAVQQDTLLGDKWTLPDRGFQSDALEECLALAESSLAKLRSVQPAQLIHFDLHQWNLKRKGDRLIALDFDDCRLAPPLMDAAISLHYLRGVRGISVDEPYFQGFGARPEDVGLTSFEFESLVMGRRLMLVNAYFDMVMSGGPDRNEYARIAIRRAEHFLKQKVYDPPSVPADR